MILNIILFVCMYPVNFILYFVYKSFGKDENMRKKGLYFGLHAPREEATREEFMKLVTEQEVLFDSRLKRCLLCTFWIPFVTLLIPSMSIGFTIWMLWFIGFLGLLMLPYIRSHQDLKAWKKEHVIMAAGENHYTELKAAGEVRKVRLLSFAIPMLLSIVTGIVYTVKHQGTYAGAFSFVIDMFALITVLFYFMALWMDRQKVMVISEDSDINLNFARAKKNCWKNLWLFCAWSNAALTVAFAVLLGMEISAGAVILSGGIIYTAVLLAEIIIVLRKVQRLEQEYEKELDGSLLPDDDDHWIWGVIYYNKQDKHAMVETRFGFGTTMNMATPLGKAMNIFGALALLSVPVLCIWMMLMEFTPIQLTVENQVLVAEQLNSDYEIPVEKITELELITELPKLSKYSGTAMDNLYKGSFHVTYGDDCEVFLNPENQYFLTFIADETLYYMSAAEDDETLEIYEMLKKSE